MAASNPEAMNALAAGDIGLLKMEARHFENRLAAIRGGIQPSDFRWYPYDTLTVFDHLDRLLQGRNRRLPELIPGRPVRPIGLGDGVRAVFLQCCGLDLED